MPYFNKFIHMVGSNREYTWPTLKNRTPKNFTITNFGHPVSKSFKSFALEFHA